jgi:DNA-binding response OmpR family regulator
MPGEKILLVDDEQDLVWSLRHSLVEEGYEVLTAYDGEKALALIEQHRPNIVILDVVMPKLDGWEVCRRIHQDPDLSATPILFLTVRRDVHDRIKGLEEGADDYLAKPFDLGELKARIRALIRRTRSLPTQGQRQLVLGSLIINWQFREVSLGDHKVQLSPLEFKLLAHFVKHPDKLFTCWELLEEVWGYRRGTADPSLVRWHIKNLRTKIESDPANPRYIHTVPHHGYMFVVSKS